MFGYGRRICPGKALADQSSWLLIAQVLSSFSVAHKRDQSGREIEVLAEGIPGIVHHPKPYVMDLKPRSEKHAEMLEDLEKELRWEQGDAGELEKMGNLRSY